MNVVKNASNLHLAALGVKMSSPHVFMVVRRVTCLGMGKLLLIFQLFFNISLSDNKNITIILSFFCVFTQGSYVL
jgi:hypothetical protein